MVFIKLIFGPTGDLGLFKTIYDLKNTYPAIDVETEFNLMCNTPLLQIGSKVISVSEYTDEELRDLIESVVTNHMKNNYLRENQQDLFQYYYRDFPPGSNFSEALI
ncbi:hypothetical protein V6M85_10465 [Sulfolobus tengchongensis]|uniref:Uncharacterized protein n=1 Tax=Sulfolobus tengchongensis TaxID=207809 RepID=A0AAX4KYA0_9CREN